MQPDGRIRRILVVKLDHLGDFIIGMPALCDLRAAFPHAHIRLICGPWNEALARQCGLVDEVRDYVYFPQNARNWDGEPCEPIARFAEGAAGDWDLAIDLRVDDDTRFLLRHVQAVRRCGIGPRSRHPFLDIVLPPELEHRFNAPDGEWAELALPPDAFTSVLQRKLPGRHETNFAASDGFLVAGPGVALPSGWLRVLFDCDIRGRGFGARKVALTFDAYAEGVVRASRRLQGREVSVLAGGPLVLDFDNPAEGTRFEFRIHCARRPLIGRLGFKGCRIQLLGTAMMPRLRRVELHIGEKLSLLVSLIRQRTQPLYAAMHDPGVSPAEHWAGQTVVIAPISNSTLRDWPPGYYRELIERLLAIPTLRVQVTGAPDQAPAITALLGSVSGHPNLRDLTGAIAWSSVPALLGAADLVICNNSGIAHLAAAIGARTLALYSASHEPAEWGPRGERVRVLIHEPPCAPCGHDTLASCRYDHVCMTALTPTEVLAASLDLLELAPVG